MKQFFKDYSFYSFKMLVTQIVIAIFGLTLSMAFSKANSDTGQIISSVFAVIFYLFLLYIDTWKVGFSDRAAIRRGETSRVPLRGLYLSLLANSINILLAILYTCGVEICRGIMSLGEGMYAGILAIPYETITNGDTTVYHILGEKWYIYFLIVIPALVICTVSYYMGLRDIRLTPLFNEKSTEKPEKPEKRTK